MNSLASTEIQYFIKLYGSQHRVNRPRLSHTFATFSEKRTSPDGSETIRDFTISWLPRDGVINPLGPPETGRNYSLAETFEWLDQAGSIVRWESLETEIQQSLFQAAEERFQELAEGPLRYKMFDRVESRPHEVSNCIHAVSDLPLALSQIGMATTGRLHGTQASRFVYRFLSPFYLVRPVFSEEEERLFDAVQRGVILSKESSASTPPDSEDVPFP